MGRAIIRNMGNDARSRASTKGKTMNIHARAQIFSRVKAATPKYANPQADAEFDEHARQDVMALLAEVERLERELALAKMQANNRAGKVPR
jgi:hypothetical protein